MKITTIQPGLYQHYKGNYYQVVGIARHSETLEELVVYHTLYGDYGLWVRPAKMFIEQIQVDGNIKSRFTFISDNRSKGPAIAK